MLRVFSLLSAALTLLLPALTALASPTRPTRLHVSKGEGGNGFPPYIVVDKTGKAGGILFDILTAAFAATSKEGEVTLETSFLPRKRLEQALKSGEIDASFQALEWMATPGDFAYSEPIISSTDVIVTTPSHEVKSVADLQGKTVVANPGFIYPALEPLFKEGRVKRLDVRGTGDLNILQLLSPQREQYAVINALTARWLIKEGLWKGEIRFSPVEAGKADFRLFFNRSRQDLAKRLDKGLAILRNNKEIDAIIARYTQLAHESAKP